MRLNEEINKINRLLNNSVVFPKKKENIQDILDRINEDIETIREKVEELESQAEDSEFEDEDEDE